MQPLALQTTQITADTGDNGSTASVAAKVATGADFSDILTAALPATGGDANASAPIDASGTSDTTAQAAIDDSKAATAAARSDQDVAALVAASQIVALAVTPPPAPPTPAETELELAVARVKQHDDETKAAPSETDGSTPENPQTPQSSSATAPDTAGLGVQALINLATMATLKPTTSAKDSARHASTANEPKLVAQQTTTTTVVDASQIPPNDASPTPVAFPTGDDAPAQEPKASLVNADSHQPIEVAQQVSTAGANQKAAQRYAATAAAAQSTPALSPAPLVKPVDHAIGNAMSDGAEPHAHSHKAPRTSEEQTLIADAPAQVAQPGPFGALVDPSSAPQPAPPSQNAAQSSDVNAAEPTISSTQLQQPQLYTPRYVNSQSALASSVAASRATDSQVKDVAKSSFLQQVTGSSPTQSSAAPQSDTGASAVVSVSSETLDPSKVLSAIRGLEQTTSQSAAASPTPPSPTSDDAPSEPIINKTSPQNLDVQLLEIAQTRSREDAKSIERVASATKDTVNIREVLKLGASEVTITSEPQSAPAPTTPAPTQAAPAQSAPDTSTVPQQAAPMASSNVETNGERRTIADDIRLRALERMLVNAARNGTQTLSIQLYPPGLGQVVLRLAMDGQRLRLATRAATTEAADTLRNMESDLRDALAGNGLHLAGFDVSEDGTQDETPNRQPTKPVVKSNTGGAAESFTVDMNA